MLIRPFQQALLGFVALVLGIGSLLAQPTLLHRYSFEGDALDSIGGADGVLQGGGAYSEGAVVLDGSSGHVDLPNGIVSTLTNATFEVWLTDNGSATWSRIFDFGFSTGGEGGSGTGTNYLFLSPQVSSGNLRASIRDNSMGGEQGVDWAGTRLPIGSLQQVVWTLDAESQISRLYVNGVPVGTNAALTRTPAQLGLTINNWLGRSQFNDPYLKASISEFRIYDGALTAEEVLDGFNSGPDIGPVELTLEPVSQSVMELAPATFTINHRGSLPVGIQWRRDGAPMEGATNRLYTIASTALTNHGAAFSVVLTNSYTNVAWSVTSSNAVLSVIADVMAPQLLSAVSLFPTNVLATFSEPLLPSTATNPANYVITHAGGSLAVTKAAFGGSASNVVLTTAVQTLGTNYTLTVNGIRDLASASNLIAANSQAAFIAATLFGEDLGDPALPGGSAEVAGGMDLTAGGTGFGGTNDQGYFAHRPYWGDFDVSVRVAALEYVSTRTLVGLMARSGLASNAPFAAAFAPPGATGCYFAARAVTNGSTTVSGAFPINYPDTWLRLRREGNTFSGYASLDGQAWAFLGATNLSLPAELEVGVALTSGTAGTATTTQFRDFNNASGSITTNAPLAFELAGPSSRRTPITITEIMYKPADRTDVRNTEFIELYNSNPWPEDISGYRLDGQVQYVFPPATTIPAQSFLVVAAVPADMQAVYGLPNVFGPYTDSLKASGSVKLHDEQGSVLLHVEYDDRLPWPEAADGTGHSIVLARPSYGEGDPQGWDRSDVMGGSPGAFEHHGVEPARGVVINEFLAHTDLPQVDYIELFNTGAQPVDLSGAWLSDEAGTNKYRIANGTTIAARGWLSFTETQLGFALSAEGETVLLVNSNQTRVLDAIYFDAQENGVTLGRYPDGAPDFQRLATVTQSAANTAPRQSPVVINEIMYNPISRDDNDEYVELYNRSGGAVNLSGWKLQGGISHTFASNTVLAAGGYLVVAENRTNLLAKYAQLNSANTAGNFNGTLADGGERVALAMVDDLITTNSSGGVSTNMIYITLDEVSYLDGGRWGRWSDGGGSSLELIDPDADNRLAANWADSDESAKAPWTTIETTGVLDNGIGNFSPLQLGLLDAGECLVDDVEAINASAVNYVGNGDFENGMTTLYFAGNHSRSSLEAGSGYPDGGTALHVRTGDGLQTAPNGIEITLTSASTNLAVGQTATLRFKARWLRGSREPLLRFWGCYLEAAGQLPVPANLGTPGLPNSRATANAGPAIYAVRHDPAVPAANQPVVVTTRVSDPDGLASVTLQYRFDPSNTTTNLAMNDAGVGGDAVAGDGIYSGTIPGRATGAAAFVVLAADGAGATNRFPELVQDNAPVRECVVFFGEPTSANLFGTYHLWLTQTNVNRWIALPKMSNEEIDGTFVYNNRIIYNMGGRYSGGPFHQAYNGPAGSFACHYIWSMPKDDMLLGTTAFNQMHFPGNDIQSDQITDPASTLIDGTLQREQAAYMFMRSLGVPWSYRRLVAVYVNGTRRGILMEDGYRPTGSAVADQYLPDDTGVQLYKIQRWYDGTSTALRSEARLQLYTTTGGAIKTARYRPVWALKETTGSLSDINNLSTMITAANAYNQSNYADVLETVVDMDNWMRMSAANHAVGNWDAFGSNSGQNMDAWVSDQRRWTLFTIDLGICLDNGSANLPLFGMNDPVWGQIIATPKYRRMYCAALNELVNGVMQANSIDPVLDAKYAAFQAAGLSPLAPTATKTRIVNQRNFIIGQLASINAATFAVDGSEFVTYSNSVTITGSAPVEITSLTINGVGYNPFWTSITNWSLTVPAPAGTNAWAIEARDRYGNPVGGSFNVSVENTSVPASPVGNVVFNEIMFKAPVPEAEYVELFNRSTNTPFDLSGWVVNGLDYSFPTGSVLLPQRYLVLAKSSVVFAATYGALIPVAGVFGGNLQSDGETLTLVRPDGGTNLTVVDRVRFEAAAPWPVITNGASLQLIDAAQDNSRVANWTLGNTNASAPIPPPLALLNYTNVWRYMQVSNLDEVAWTATNFNDSTWPSGGGLVAFENNAAITPLTNTVLNDPRMATNGMTSGHAYYFRTTMHLASNLAGYSVTASAYIDDGAVFYVNGVEVPTRIRMNVGTVTNATLASGVPPNSSDATVPDTFAIPATYFVTGTNVIAAEVHQRTTDSSDIVFGLQLNAVYTNSVNGPTTLFTPGFSNSVAGTLPAFPPLWLNEVQANNVTGPLDNYGQHEPWTEIYNAAVTNVSLAGYYLSDNYTNLTKWALPAGTNVGANGFRVVWCDGETNQTAVGWLHAAFRLATNGSRLALSRTINGTTQLVDYLNYAGTPLNWSYGDVPDGQPFYRQAMFHVTPGVTNNGASAPLTLFINEWMADNTAFLVDPADSNFEDWFELYNPGTNAVDLGGYYLTDNLTNQFKFQVPNNGHYVVPPGGYLLVWADDETGQNSTNRMDLHANFALGKGGEAIGVFAEDGTAIDAITFGAQTSNVSEGRFPDGAASLFAMPTPTPRAANVVPNTAPVLAAISNRFLTLGQTLTLTASATDGDVPTQLLSYSLATSPPGAQIGEGSGVLTWTPSTAPSTNGFEVVVTDDGAPSLNDTQAFTVVVVPRPQLGGFTVNGTAMIFSWQSALGQRYQVEYKADLTDAVWIEVGGEQAGTGGMLSHTNAIEGLPRSFFRLLVLP